MAHDIRKPKAGRARPLTVVWRRVEVLRRDSASPRSHSPTQIRRLALSIGAFGFNVPILVDPTLRIIAGHARLLAARELGWREVPTILLDHLSLAKARAFMIADNRLAEGAAWNSGLLREQLTELSQAEPDLAIEATGFEREGIDLQLAGGARKRRRQPPRVIAPVGAAEAEATAAPPALILAGARG
jgi:ParB-like chromosome segregation protein Spo0J